MSRLSSLTISYIKRNIKKRAPLSSELFSDVFAELGQDLSLLSSEWNGYIIPLFSTIPDGTDDATVDAFADGHSGTTLYADALATLINNPDYYNSAETRPNTIEEQFDNLYTYVDEQVAASEQYRTVTKTANYTIVSTESDTVFYNTVGVAQKTLSLPDGTLGAGLSYLFYSTDANGIKIAATGLDTIALGASTSASAGYIETAEQGASCRLINYAPNKWAAIYYTGTWSVV